ncbi:hypothetical protein ACFC18_55305, partial [Streptomyces sp. NPDC056121]
MLPPGKRIAVNPDTPVPDAITTYEVAVDRQVVLSVEREQREPGATARDIAVDQLPTHETESAAARTIAYTDSAAGSIPGAPPRAWSRRTSPRSSGSSNRDT